MTPSATASPGHGVRVLRNPTTIAGVVLTTVAALLFLAVVVLDALGFLRHANPYIGIFVFILLPAIFVVGLALMPLGAWRERRRLQRGLPASLRTWPRLDLNHRRVRTVLFTVAVLTPVNLLIVALASVKSVEAVDSVSFCTQTCHEVMEPEATAHRNGPHAAVKCASCHIGPGPEWFVKAKLNGAHQVYGVLTNSHARPVPAPVEGMRTAFETCVQCHSPQRLRGEKPVSRREYASDEANTESVTNLMIHVGGITPAGEALGIHWHAAQQHVVEYIALDRQRQQFGMIRHTKPNGEVTEYYAEGVTPEQLSAGERRRMDCLDCHNRAGHPFAPSGDAAVNALLASNVVPRDLPFFKREAVAALEDVTSTSHDAVANRLTAFYRDSYPAVWRDRQDVVTRAAGAAQAIRDRNVFPGMKVGWGQYPDNLGHMSSPGCFRCHDESHKSKQGKVISQDCALCHEMQ